MRSSRQGGLGQILSRIGVRPPAPHSARCANCGITIDADDERAVRSAPDGESSGGPAVATYCCDGCAEGGPCTC
ncbi:MAG: hypothetical protein ACRDGT_01955 [Candidatus Limnocylindria bacterium]